MRAMVVYESMFGNTHTVAEQIGRGLGADFDVTVLSVGDAIAHPLADVDLVVVGGPTHAHGMSRHNSRNSAVEQAERDPDLTIEPDAAGPGLRDWFKTLDSVTSVTSVRAAAFDTRIDAPEILTGHASSGIAKQLRRHGFDLVVEPESFLVDRHSHLLPGEDERATEWGEAVAAATSVA